MNALHKISKLIARHEYSTSTKLLPDGRMVFTSKGSMEFKAVVIPSKDDVEAYLEALNPHSGFKRSIEVTIGGSVADYVISDVEATAYQIPQVDTPAPACQR